MADELRQPFREISDQEIDWVCTVMRLPRSAFSGEDGTDPRLGVMRSLEMLDVEACPGSGKTTLLVAKLAILASRWTSGREGICVLSHTNAARTEIGGRLSTTSAGHVLLRHPHFVGTIHSFVNEFLAMPWLRSKDCPIKVIDTDLALKDRWFRLPYGTRKYLEMQYSGPQALTYTEADFKGGGKSDFSETKDTHRNMLTACKQSSEAGYYCFDEMFVWASELLNLRPDVIGTIRRRFPLVFVDEVQDNSELQSAFLHRLFIDGKEPVIRQRFGDSNQAIYHRSGASGAVTDPFPGASKADLPNSFRFSQSTADVAAPLGVRPQALVGKGPTQSLVHHAAVQNVLFIFDDASVLGVLPAYAQCLIDTFSAEALAHGEFTAVAAVHRAEKNDHLPRFMGHYAPNYVPDVAGRQPKLASFAQYLARARLELVAERNTHPIANRYAEGILHFLRLAGVEAPVVLKKSASRYLLELISDENVRLLHLSLVGRLVDTRGVVSQEDWQRHVVPTVLAMGASLIGREVEERNALDFLAWSDVDEDLDVSGGKPKLTNFFNYPSDAPLVSIRLGSIHSVKGETHTATLVLESYQKTHHLKKLVPWLLGKKPKAGADNSGEDAALIERLKLHYVALTRPSHLLCVAMRKDSFKDAELDQMRARNWRIVECEKPSSSRD